MTRSELMKEIEREVEFISNMQRQNGGSYVVKQFPNVGKSKSTNYLIEMIEGENNNAS